MKAVLPATIHEARPVVRVAAPRVAGESLDGAQCGLWLEELFRTLNRDDAGDGEFW
jgi:hypothetical protein